MNDILANKKIKIASEAEYDMLVDFAFSQGYTFKTSGTRKPEYRADMYAFFIYGDNKKISYMYSQGNEIGESEYFNNHRLEEMHVAEIAGNSSTIVKVLLEEKQKLEELLNYITVYAYNLVEIANSMPTAATDDFSDEHIAAWNVHHDFIKKFGKEKALEIFKKYNNVRSIPPQVEQSN